MSRLTTCVYNKAMKVNIFILIEIKLLSVIYGWMLQSVIGLSFQMNLLFDKTIMFVTVTNLISA